MSGYMLSELYSQIDYLMRSDQIEKIDQEIKKVVIDAEKIDTDFLLGWLIATLPVKNRLVNRRSLHKITKRLIKKRGQWERGIMQGLK